MRRLALLAVLLLLSGCTTDMNTPKAVPAQPASPAPAATPSWKVRQVSLVSDSTLWVLANGGDDWVPLSVLRTADGGQTWRDVTPPKIPRDRLYAPTAYFTDADTGWVAVRNTREKGDPMDIAHTVDGGQSWSVNPVPVVDWEVAPWLSFMNASEGWLVVTSGPALGTMFKSVYHTTDAGEHWEMVSRGEGQGATPTREHLPNTEYVTGVTFRTSSEGWVTDLYRTTPEVPLWHTEDGGRTWQRQPLAYPEAGGPFRYCDAFPPRFFGDERTGGVLMLGCRNNPGSVVPSFTADGGKTWLPRTGVPGIITGAGNYDFVTLDQGWVLVDSGALYATADGGRTWERRTEALDGYGKIDFADATHGWATDRNGALMETRDGGRTWAPVSVSVR